MLRMVTTGSVITYMLYTIEAQTIRSNEYKMLLTIPFVVYGIFRYLYLIHVEGEGSAPDELLFKDWPLLLSVVAWVASVGVILYLLGERAAPHAPGTRARPWQDHPVRRARCCPRPARDRGAARGGASTGRSNPG